MLTSAICELERSKTFNQLDQEQQSERQERLVGFECAGLKHKTYWAKNDNRKCKNN